MPLMSAFNLCLYRALFGGFFAAEVLSWLPYAPERFSNSSFHVANFAWFPAPLPQFTYLLVFILFLSSLAVALGFHTKRAIATTLILWAYLYGIDRINERAIYSIFFVVFTILWFAPCDQTLSYDAVHRKNKEEKLISPWYYFLLRFEFAQIYFFSSFVKLRNPSWRNGQLISDIFSSRWTTPVASIIDPYLSMEACRWIGLGTIFLEMSLPFFLFSKKTRPYAIAVGVCFHLGIEVVFSIGSLGLHFMLALVVLFNEPLDRYVFGENSPFRHWKTKLTVPSP